MQISAASSRMRWAGLPATLAPSCAVNRYSKPGGVRSFPFRCFTFCNIMNIPRATGAALSRYPNGPIVLSHRWMNSPRPSSRFYDSRKNEARSALKDQCAYNRTLAYDVVAKGDAEPIFNRLLNDANAVLGWPDAKALDDYLFHQYMRFARELDYPVQIHTGHMAGTYNRVDKANVRLFVPVLELHRDVKIDLFHGNWPYMGDLLFVAKNYPNVALNLTWLYIIDPLYAQRLLERAVMTVPHSKIHAYGGDYTDIPERAVAHLKLARHVIAAALANHVEKGWLDEEQAQAIARHWFFDNPKRFFALADE